MTLEEKRYEVVDIPPDSGFLLIMNIPKGTNFGLDYVEWQVTEKFCGIQGIPTGVHFIYTSPTSKQGDFTARLGFFLNIKPRAVEVWRWDPYLEYLVPFKEEQESVRYRLGVQRGDFKSRMSPYPMDYLPQWLSISNWITSLVLNRVAPVKSLMASTALHEEIEKDNEARASSSGQDTGLTACEGMDQETKVSNEKAMVDVTSFRAFYTDLPSKRERGILPEERTKRAIDGSYVLDLLLRKYPADQEQALLLGEFQFAFVSFLLGQCFDGLEQWKNLINVLSSSCSNDTCKHQALITSVLKILESQLKLLPRDFFTDELLEGNFLKPCLENLFQQLRRSQTSNELCSAAELLRKTAESHFGWILPKVGLAPYTPEDAASLTAEDELTKVTEMVDGLVLTQSENGSYFVVDEDGRQIPVVLNK